MKAYTLLVAVPLLLLVVPVASAHTASGCEFGCHPASNVLSIGATVKNWSSGGGISLANVTVCPMGETCVVNVSAYTYANNTNATGFAGFWNLPAGNFQLLVKKAGYVGANSSVNVANTADTFNVTIWLNATPSVHVPCSKCGGNSTNDSNGTGSGSTGGTTPSLMQSNHGLPVWAWLLIVVAVTVGLVASSRKLKGGKR